MTEPATTMLEQQRYGAWRRIVLRSTALSQAQPGQFVALRVTPPGSLDPLLRRPLTITETDVQQGTCAVLLDEHDPARPFFDQLAPGAALDLLGPLGTGWQLDPGTRTLALVGTAGAAAPLFALAHAAVRRGIAVSLLLGAPSRDDAPPPFLLPAAAEYNVAQSKAFASAAIALLDDGVLRWADMLALALPQPYWSAVARRISQVRIRWSRGFAQVAVLQPDADLVACCVGVCGVCGVETGRRFKLACVEGPVFDLQDLVRT